MKHIILLVLAVALLSGCTSSGPKRVSATEFKKHYAQVGMAQTAHAHSYLGQRDDCVYLKVSSKSAFGGWTDRTIYIELADLDPTFREALPKIELPDSGTRLQ